MWLTDPFWVFVIEHGPMLVLSPLVFAAGFVIGRVAQSQGGLFPSYWRW